MMYTQSQIVLCKTWRARLTTELWPSRLAQYDSTSCLCHKDLINCTASDMSQLTDKWRQWFDALIVATHARVITMAAGVYEALGVPVKRVVLPVRREGAQNRAHPLRSLLRHHRHLYPAKARPRARNTTLNHRQTFKQKAGSFGSARGQRTLAPPRRNPTRLLVFESPTAPPNSNNPSS